MNGEEQSFKREFWRPDEHRVWVRKQPRWGWGWTINWAEVRRRLRLGDNLRLAPVDRE